MREAGGGTSVPRRRGPAFGVIAYLPNLEGNGNALLLEGIGISGTEVAMDFMDDDTQLLRTSRCHCSRRERTQNSPRQFQ